MSDLLNDPMPEADLGRRYAQGCITLDELTTELAAIWRMRDHLAVQRFNARTHLLGLVIDAYVSLGLEFPGLIAHQEPDHA